MQTPAVLGRTFPVSQAVLGVGDPLAVVTITLGTSRMHPETPKHLQSNFVGCPVSKYCCRVCVCVVDMLSNYVFFVPGRSRISGQVGRCRRPGRNRHPADLPAEHVDSCVFVCVCAYIPKP